MEKSKAVIIVAGGKGTRMKSKIPKQFLLFQKEPIIITTIKKFLSYDANISIILVLPKPYFKHWNELKTEYLPQTTIKITQGGATRTESVKNGLSLVTEELIAIHDAVRPFVTPEIIHNCFNSAKKNGSGIASVDLKDSIRKIQKDGNSSSENRNEYKIVQTPQTFNTILLKEAYQKIKDQNFSDDATVFEKAGQKVFLVVGSYANIKITTPEDLN